MLLPISDYEREIAEAVKTHNFTIISAETGSGKSTQVPQYLAKHYSQVIVTEPRIMAAKTLAKRVSEEMEVTLGEEVGYRTGYDKCSRADSKIIYCTDGFQLVHTIFNEDSETEKVLIIDEVHTWNLNIEILVAFCKFMKNSWKTKVVIMSATVETEKLANFFEEDVAIINIPGSLFKVEMETKGEHEFIPTIIEKIQKRKNILIFVPGKKEIEKVIGDLSKEDATVLPLHGELDWEEQKKCFMKYYNSKVIVSTNIAQTSVTIPDIDVVIDSGKEKASIARNGVQGLEVVEISKADITQRKGRAGRTKNGEYILCSYLEYERRSDYPIPEIQRSILDKVVLQLLAIGLDPEKLEFFHNPKEGSIANAKKQLYKLGAIDESENVTEIGKQMSKIPVSAKTARMIVEAEKYNATEQVMIISAIIEMGGLLKKGTSYFTFTKENQSDLLAELDVWNFIADQGYVDFEKYGINKINFFKIKEHIKKLREVLESIVEIKKTENRQGILKACLTGYVSSIFTSSYGYNYIGEDGYESRLNRNSCIYGNPTFIVGTPLRLENFQLINFATIIDEKTIMSLVPQSEIEERTKLSYNPGEDAVEIMTQKLFNGVIVETSSKLEYPHPEYSRLKEEYEARRNWGYSSYIERITVKIDGKEFEVHTNFMSNMRMYIILDDETLFTTSEQNITLKSGEKIWLTSMHMHGERATVSELRNAVRESITRNAIKRKQIEYSMVKIQSIDDICENQEKIGKINLTPNDWENADNPIITYGYLRLQKNTVTLGLTDNEEKAAESTREATQYLFIKHISKEYSDRKFSNSSGKKKKILTESEAEVKRDFDSLVRELLLNLTIENIRESLEFIEEYYQELMEGKK